MSVFGMQDNQHSAVALSFADKFGNAVPDAIDAGSLTTTSSDPASLTASVGADGVSLLCTADGPLDANVVVTAACTVGGVAFDGSETFEIGASAPTQMELTPSAPVAN